MMSHLSNTARAIIDSALAVTADGSSHIAHDGLRIFQHPERLRAILEGRPHDIIPVTVELWPSLSCNARCPSCPYRLSDARDDADVSKDLILHDTNEALRTITELAVAGVNSVIFTGGGDPLLNPQLQKLVYHAKNCGLRWALFTNGIALTEERATTLFGATPDFFRISLDAGTADEYQKVYGSKKADFEGVVQNAINAATVAKTYGFNGFGLSFTLTPSVSDNELEAIRKVILRVQNASGGGLGFVAFRPRIFHYKDETPICPQPFKESYVALAGRITERIQTPLISAQEITLRVDVKESLFVVADNPKPPQTCLSSGWMTNIDHRGWGYSVAELTGSSSPISLWGHLSDNNSFQNAWNSERRRSVHDALATGSLKVPVVHRTLPVDAMLKVLASCVVGPFEKAVVDEVIDELEAIPFYRSKNPFFV